MIGGGHSWFGVCLVVRYRLNKVRANVEDFFQRSAGQIEKLE